MTESEDPFDRIVDTLKEPVWTAPSLTSRIMAEVDALPRHVEPLAGSSPWWRRRWTIRLSPLGGLAAAACLTAVVVGARLAGGRGAPDAPVAPASVELLQPTQFVLVASKAASVAIVGDFNDWNVSATPLARSDGNGVWWVTVPLLPGRYRYSFVVDGTTWLSDPEASPAEDEFGRPNSVVTIGGP